MPSSQQLDSVIHEWVGAFMHHSAKDFKRFIKQTGLTISQVTVLIRLVHEGQAGISELGGNLGITNAAASQAVERLVQLGLVARTEDPSDRRARRLEITPQGRSLMENCVSARCTWLKEITESLSPDQQAAVITTFSLLTQAVRQPQK